MIRVPCSNCPGDVCGAWIANPRSFVDSQGQASGERLIRA
jgi:hypothetical protein